MDMRKSVAPRRNKRRGIWGKALSVIFSVIFPPVGIYLVWRARWSVTARYCLTGMAVVCMVLMVAFLPSADSRVNGGIEMVGRERIAEIYGPDLPTAMVTGYVAPPAESIFVKDDVEGTVYVFATADGHFYHLEQCQYAYASAQKLTPYQAFYMGYLPCELCGAPAYIPGTIQ